jgi:hypothetical protein
MPWATLPTIQSLLRPTKESYSYDAVGNRLSSLGVPTYDYNSSNELMSNSSGSYTYDANVRPPCLRRTARTSYPLSLV